MPRPATMSAKAFIKFIRTGGAAYKAKGLDPG
jgi:hypothetical protein